MPCVSNIIEQCWSVHDSDYCCWCGVVHTVSSWYVSDMGKREEYCELGIKTIVDSRRCDL